MLSIEEIIPFFSGKGKILLLIFFCLPFSQIFGLAIPFGFIIAYLGLRYAFLKESWAPDFILKKKIPSKILNFVLGQILYFIKIIGKLSHPRFSWISTESHMRKISGSLISLVGIFLAISLPIPFSSYIASAAILFIGVGISNDDGIWICIGYMLSIFYMVFVAVTLNYISIIDIISYFNFF
ncbi:MAG: exopolysaccharide biosynthesis protein [Candidatus Protochlamydia sp.]|nr:exopolysaccharide biosynthesis protein [Candidatus Protochlamydia sp.]